MISSLKNLIYKSRKLFDESQISFNNLDLLLLKIIAIVALIVALVSFFMITSEVIKNLDSYRYIIKTYLPYYVLPIIFLLVCYFCVRQYKQARLSNKK